MTLLAVLFAVGHVLAGAAWFGSMFYSLTVLQPRAARFFATPGQFEEFIAVVSAGARWKVLAAFAFVAVTGLALLVLGRPGPVSSLWWALVGAKLGLFLAALAVFWYVSWRLWPARVVALPEEVPGIQRRFRRIGWSMIVLVGLNLVLGIIAHRL